MCSFNQGDVMRRFSALAASSLSVALQLIGFLDTLLMSAIIDLYLLEERLFNGTRNVLDRFRTN